ncbi:hypothetical protein C8R43DRAFT_1192522 [Mycena crocata]|nr:hypothetical protein C8R43DRAFT_1192522 [Mycena crocata]
MTFQLRTSQVPGRPLGDEVNFIVESSESILDRFWHSYSRVDTTTRSSKPKNVRASAWRPPNFAPVFARNPPTFIEYKFKRMSADTEGTSVKVSMDTEAKFETILVASDWKAGLAIKNKGQTATETADTIHKTGFIGQGSSKNVVYARIGNKEYAIGQSRDESLPPMDNTVMLRNELSTMLTAEFIRKEFVTCASDCDMGLPDFQFNVDGAFIGVLQPLEEGHISTSLGLPFLDFIATSYLPCSTAERGIKKFTGNADCGDPPADGDALMAAIHAFTHFGIIYTNQGLAFCDLQGMTNREGNMRLIDPQSHSSQPDYRKRIYWDGGPEAIQRFLDHHLKDCDNNYICNKMDMQNMEFQCLTNDNFNNDDGLGTARGVKVDDLVIQLLNKREVTGHKSTVTASFVGTLAQWLEHFS